MNDTCFCAARHEWVVLIGALTASWRGERICFSGVKQKRKKERMFSPTEPGKKKRLFAHVTAGRRVFMRVSF